MLSAEMNQLLTQTGAGTPMGELFRNFWTPFLKSDELPEPNCPPVRVRLLGENLVAFRDSEGKVGLISAYCPHRRAPMFFGRNEDCGLRCVYHGWKFDRSGKCVDMPNEPEESRFKEKIKIDSYPTREAGGLVWAYMGQAKEELPEFPELEFTKVPSSHVFIAKVELNANYMQALEGSIDSSHVSFLHATPHGKMSMGGAGVKRSNKLEKYWFHNKNPKFFLKENDHGLLIGARRPAEEDTYFWRITNWLKPYYSIIPAEIGNPIGCFIHVPIDDEHCSFMLVYWHPERPLTEKERDSYENSGLLAPQLIPGTFIPVANQSNDYLIDREVQKHDEYTGIQSIVMQDAAMWEGMGSIVDRTQEHLGTSDAAIIQVRRMLIKAAQNYEAGHLPIAAVNGAGYNVRSASMLIAKELEFDIGAEEYLNGKKWAERVEA